MRGRHRLRRPHHSQLAWPGTGTGRSRIGPPPWINFGQDGFNSLLETKYLQKLLIEDHPCRSLIVFYDGGNDCAYFAQDRTPYGHQGYERVRGMIEDYHRSLFGLLKPLNAAMWSSFTHEIYDKMRQGVFPIAPGFPKLAAICGQLRPAVRLPRARWPPPSGPNSCWSTSPAGGRKRSRWPRASGRRKRGPGEKKLAFRANFMVCYQALVARLQDKPYFVNFRNILCNREKPLYQPDGIHLVDAGREIVATHMEEVLKERLLAGESPAKPVAGMPREKKRSGAQR